MKQLSLSDEFLTVNQILAERHYLGPIDRGDSYLDEWGVLVLANPSSRRLPQKRWLELVRWCLYGIPNGGSQQWAAVSRWLRQTRPDVTTVVSYSDPSVGHTGALYRACNCAGRGWVYNCRPVRVVASVHLRRRRSRRRALRDSARAALSIGATIGVEPHEVAMASEPSKPKEQDSRQCEYLSQSMIPNYRCRLPEGHKLPHEFTVDVGGLLPAPAEPFRIMVDRDADLRREMRAYLDTMVITSENIGDIRRSLFVPWDSPWNGWVRDDTAARENVVLPAQAPRGWQPLKELAEWIEHYYGAALVEVGCPCDKSRGVVCPLHTALSLPAPAEPTRFMWLMERRLAFDDGVLRSTPAGTLVYWDGGHAESFTTDPYKAVQWGTKEAAILACPPEHYAQWGWSYVEHGFIGPLPAEATRGWQPIETAPKDGTVDAIQYKSDYLIKKHGDKEEIERLRAALAAVSPTQKTEEKKDDHTRGGS